MVFFGGDKRQPEMRLCTQAILPTVSLRFQISRGKCKRRLYPLSRVWSVSLPGLLSRTVAGDRGVSSVNGERCVFRVKMSLAVFQFLRYTVALDHSLN